MLSSDYILGFVEGEGCFNVSIAKYVNYRARETGRKSLRKSKAFPFVVKPSFRVVCVERDRAVLESIKEAIGVGNIYINHRKDSVKHQDMAHYYVQTFADLVTVREFFEKHVFMTTKGEDFKRWCKCLDIILSGKHKTKEGFLELCGLREQMNVHTGKSTMWKPEEIAKVFEENEDIETGSSQETQKLIHNNISTI